MGLKELLQKIKETAAVAKPGPEKKKNSTYPNRFVKFYHDNKGRLSKERKSLYYQKKQKGICVRCNRKVQEGIIFCDYHRQKQVSYNQKARAK